MGWHAVELLKEWADTHARWRLVAIDRDGAGDWVCTVKHVTGRYVAEVPGAWVRTPRHPECARPEVCGAGNLFRFLAFAADVDRGDEPWDGSRSRVSSSGPRRLPVGRWMH